MKLILYAVLGTVGFAMPFFPLSFKSLPSNVRLAIPKASYVRLMPGCKWGNGTKHLVITRHIGQGINFVNLDSAKHRLKYVSGAQIPLPAYYLSKYGTFGMIWRVPTKTTLSTCSGTVKLTLTIS